MENKKLNHLKEELADLKREKELFQLEAKIKELKITKCLKEIGRLPTTANKTDRKTVITPLDECKPGVFETDFIPRGRNQIANDRFRLEANENRWGGYPTEDYTRTFPTNEEFAQWGEAAETTRDTHTMDKQPEDQGLLDMEEDSDEEGAVMVPPQRGIIASAQPTPRIDASFLFADDGAGEWELTRLQRAMRTTYRNKMSGQITIVTCTSEEDGQEGTTTNRAGTRTQVKDTPR